MVWGLSKTRPLGRVHVIDGRGHPSTLQGKLRMRPYVTFIPPGKIKLKQQADLMYNSDTIWKKNLKSGKKNQQSLAANIQYICVLIVKDGTTYL